MALELFDGSLVGYVSPSETNECLAGWLNSKPNKPEERRTTVKISKKVLVESGLKRIESADPLMKKVFEVAKEMLSDPTYLNGISGDDVSNKISVKSGKEYHGILKSIAFGALGILDMDDRDGKTYFKFSQIYQDYLSGKLK